MASTAANWPTATGVRMRVTTGLVPTAWVQINITVRLRDPLPGPPAGGRIDNCIQATSATAAVAGTNPDGALFPTTNLPCAAVDIAAREPAAVLFKNITPDTLPAWIPGQQPQPAQVELRIANTGNVSADYLEITDADADFFDAVTFAGFGARQNPGGAVDRLRIEAKLDGPAGPWTQIYSGNAGTPTATFPGGKSADDVVGLRFRFDNTTGAQINPCAATVTEAGGTVTDLTGGCVGIVRFNVTTRDALQSSGEPLPSVLSDTATGNFLTTGDDPTTPRSTNPSTDTITLGAGSPDVSIDKSTNTCAAARRHHIADDRGHEHWHRGSRTSPSGTCSRVAWRSTRATNRWPTARAIQRQRGTCKPPRSDRVGLDGSHR